jgi:hypothetical protein
MARRWLADRDKWSLLTIILAAMDPGIHNFRLDARRANFQGGFLKAAGTACPKGAP